MKERTKTTGIVVYQAKSGALEFKISDGQETFLITQQQVAQIFDVQKSAISKHVRNIFKSGELSKKATVSKMETVRMEGKRSVKRVVEYYDLDLVLSVGYRVNSFKATRFRQWATKTLRSHIIEGYTLNRQRLGKNYETFLDAVEKVRRLLPETGAIDADSVIELVKMFAATWFSLEAFDKASLPTNGATKKQVEFTSQELSSALGDLKRELQAKEQASDLFGIERSSGSIASIVGNIFQSFGGKDVYPSVEEKAAHLLYFVVKNHPFTDGNKRSGAFSFIWFLRKASLLDASRLTPEALTVLTLLIAESDPKNKSQMIGLVLLLLARK